MKTLVVLHGPTASGKTALALPLARALDAEIISCDSRQFYRQMRIGTAVPTADELTQVPHHFIQFLDIERDYSVGDYERDALAFLDDYFQRKETALMVGGSGFYARAVCRGMDEFPEVAESIRTELRQLLAEKGIEALQTELAAKDPDYYARVDRQNPARLLRALEICRSTGQPFSSFHTGKSAERPFRIVQLALDWDRDALYARIDARVLAMMQQGLLAEVQALLPYRHCNALNTVGYKELFEYLDGKTTLEQAVADIQRNTRRYAKRQLTWLRQDAHIHWIHCPIDPEKVVEDVQKLLSCP